MQYTANANFTIETKFTSAVTRGYQGQGLLVEQDTQQLSAVRCFLGQRHTQYSTRPTLPAAQPPRRGSIELSRRGIPIIFALPAQAASGHWTIRLTASNGQTAQALPALTVQSVGLFASNYADSGPAPAFTAAADYFKTSNPPIGSEPKISGYAYGPIGQPLSGVTITGMHDWHNHYRRQTASTALKCPTAGAER